ncbi:MAG: toxin-activating lysine-acyltransferase [Rhodospirillaceae bacterium]|jgi:cytolysin-activating lysine-acyltransferase|nr:toxin-activating lysine-acyltransferase [Rhodospirillaceae bacterium]MBT4688410.1 toxin-activating lysine-acyltransferase [Rhodospirillaceae bacterium]MBT5081768.1 toxin-activating lysine-acyltransferase [Rhodospirillaceae bacterium]MBT5527370.1 toxin-activating lysine-acyltransferase [Rhodospirillaceae bacterium]MBT5881748.1 toxin-activating lysine-acyltransferase [Rhodospirillaceae bacterium]
MSGPEGVAGPETGGAIDGSINVANGGGTKHGPAVTDAPAEMPVAGPEDEAGGEAKNASDRSAQNRSELMGQAGWLMMQSRGHRHLFMTDMEWLLLPPLALSQFRLWRHENRPAAFATWAHLSDDAEQSLLARAGIDNTGVANGDEAENTPPQTPPLPAMAAPRFRLAPGDWRSGSNLWLIDFVCPFGGIVEAVQQLRAQTFKDRAVKILRPRANGKGLETGVWTG